MEPEQIEAVLARVPAFAGQRFDWNQLSGGLTNTNVKVTLADGRVCVARLSSKDADLLSIDRHAEYENSLRAAASGVAPAVVEYVPDDHVLVVSFVDGRTYEPEDLRDSVNIPRAADAVRLLHRGPRFVNDFNMFRIQGRYRQICAERGFRLPDRYDDFANHVLRIEAALAVRDEGTVPCNNDLLAANFIDDGERIWLIDWEYAGNNDACFELGNVWSESNLSLEQLSELVEAYYGVHRSSRIARARLLGLMSKYGWTLWGSIQEATSPIDFDFWDWAMEKYDRAVSEFSSAGFDRLLDQATADD